MRRGEKRATAAPGSWPTIIVTVFANQSRWPLLRELKNVTAAASACVHAYYIHACKQHNHVAVAVALPSGPLRFTMHLLTCLILAQIDETLPQYPLPPSLPPSFSAPTTRNTRKNQPPRSAISTGVLRRSRGETPPQTRTRRRNRRRRRRHRRLGTVGLVVVSPLAAGATSRSKAFRARCRGASSATSSCGRSSP